MAARLGVTDPISLAKPSARDFQLTEGMEKVRTEEPKIRKGRERCCERTVDPSSSTTTRQTVHAAEGEGREETRRRDEQQKNVEGRVTD